MTKLEILANSITSDRQDFIADLKAGLFIGRPEELKKAEERTKAKVARYEALREFEREKRGIADEENMNNNLFPKDKIILRRYFDPEREKVFYCASTKGSLFESIISFEDALAGLFIGRPEELEKAKERTKAKVARYEALREFEREQMQILGRFRCSKYGIS